MPSNVSTPPDLPEGGWIKPVPRGPIMFMPYLVYLYGQVMFRNRGSIGYEWKNCKDDEGFILYLKVEEQDRQVCESLSDIEELWARIKPRRGGN